MVHDMRDRTAGEIRAALILADHFPQLAQGASLAFLDDFVALSAFLAAGPPSVDPYLRHLDLCMQERIGAQRDPSQIGLAQTYMQDWQGRAPVSWDRKKGFVDNPQVKPKTKAFSHILSTELTLAEEQAGFTIHLGKDERMVPTYVGALTPNQFNANLVIGHHWKDVGVIPRHGEFTHRIQWYLINRAQVLRQRPCVVFQQIGRNGPASNPPPKAQGGFYLWDALVDRGVWEAQQPYFKTPYTDDFRSPEYLNDYLTSDIAIGKFPLLGTFLKARKAKRDGVDLEEYAAQKLYKKRWGALTQGEQERVMTYVSRSTGASVLT